MLASLLFATHRRPGVRRRWQRLARRIVALSDDWRSQSDAALRNEALALPWRADAEAGQDALLLSVYALVREACRRVHGQAHFDVQLLAGLALTEGGVAEMQTGEGKTLTALLPTVWHALAGRGAHVITANDYLARRDADFARGVLELLGLRAGCVHSDLPPEERGPEYACDVTYGTAREFGFDFLRDRLREERGEQRFVQRGQYFALVDEADNVLIDDARTPLLIATSEAQDGTTTRLYHWCHEAAGELTADLDYQLELRTRQATLTHHGCRRVVALGKTRALDDCDLLQIYRQVEHSLIARYLLQNDRDYLVRDEKVSIVDGSTGRVTSGRQWQDGLQQAVELSAGVPLSEATRTAARMTVQNYFRRYTHLVGLTGTAYSAQREFRDVFGLGVVEIPTRRPCQLRGLRPRIFVSEATKHRAVTQEVQARVRAGRAVLVGTSSIATSETLSAVFDEAGIAHDVLNCRRHEQEARIVAGAGRRGRVTIATNMAGRGTDIRVDEEVQRAGGLHVIATEMHASARIDRQLIGRTARQGAPGSYQFLLSLEDELLAVSGRDPCRLRLSAAANAEGELPARWYRLFTAAQTKLEKRHERERKQLLKQEQRRERVCGDLGLDPLLEILEAA